MGASERTGEPGRERVIESLRVFEGRKAALRVDKVELADGKTSEREIVEHPGVAAVVPMDEDGCIIMVRQYRLAAEDVLLEIPAGVMNSGETPEQTANRELAEETGLRAGMLTKLAEFYVSPGISTEVIHLFLAEDLDDAPGQADDDEDIVTQKVPASTAVLMVDHGEFADAKTIAGILLTARVRRILH
jgi:ADP-ribose pyrophosphatase